MKIRQLLTQATIRFGSVSEDPELSIKSVLNENPENQYTTAGFCVES